MREHRQPAEDALSLAQQLKRLGAQIVVNEDGECGIWVHFGDYVNCQAFTDDCVDRLDNLGHSDEVPDLVAFIEYLRARAVVPEREDA